MPERLGKILVIRGGAIGDFILTVPVLTALRQQFPNVGLDLLGYPRVAALAQAAGLVDAAQPIDARPMASFFAKGGPLPTALSDYFAGCAVIISYLFDPDRIFQENVARASKAQFIIGPHRPDESGALHATDAFLQPLVRLAIFDADPVPRLRIKPLPQTEPGTSSPTLAQPPDQIAPQILSLFTGGLSAPPIPRPQPGHLAPDHLTPLLYPHWLAIHPGSGSERKNWPEENWAALLDYLTTHTELRLLLVGGEAEGDRLQRLAAALPTDRVRIAQSLPLPDLAVLLQQCWAYLGHDSGISHLAAALGLGGVILWGPTRQEIWRPRSDRFQILSSPTGLSGLNVANVVAALQRLN